MKKFLASSAGALASLLLLLSGEAIANGTLTVTLADYNSAQVAANNSVVTVPIGHTVGGVTYVVEYTLTNGTSLEASSLLEVSLPDGFTFVSPPSLYFSQFAGADANVISGGVGTQSVIFQIVNKVTTGSVFIHSPFEVNAPALADQVGTLPYTLSFQAIGNTTAGDNDTNPVSQPAFAHAVGALPNTISAPAGQIDLSNPFYGDQFVASGSTVPDSGLVGIFEISTEVQDIFNAYVPVLNPSGGLNELAPGDTGNVEVDGVFNGIGLAYADTTTSGNCQGAIPSGAGVYAGTVTDASLTFSGIPIDTPVQICIIPYGVMWAATVPYVFGYTPGAGVTDFFGGISQNTQYNFYTYSAAPTTVVNVLGGSPQTTTVGSGFCAPIAVQAYDTSTNPPYPLKGIDIVFDAPASNQSAYFVNAVGEFAGSIMLEASANGIALSSIAANSTAGIYTITANVGNVKATFGLTNEPGVNDQVYCNGFEY